MTREEFFYQCMDIIEHWLNGNRKLSDLREVTDKLYNEVTKPHWVSVEDELPKDYEWVLCYNDIEREYEVLMYYDRCWWTYEGRFVSPDITTHWMPLPSVEHFREATKMIKEGGEE